LASFPASRPVARDRQRPLLRRFRWATRINPRGTLFRSSQTVDGPTEQTKRSASRGPSCPAAGDQPTRMSRAPDRVAGEACDVNSQGPASKGRGRDILPPSPAEDGRGRGGIHDVKLPGSLGPPAFLMCPQAETVDGRPGQPGPGSVPLHGQVARAERFSSRRGHLGLRRRPLDDAVATDGSNRAVSPRRYRPCHRPLKAKTRFGSRCSHHPSCVRFVESGGESLVPQGRPRAGLQAPTMCGTTAQPRRSMLASLGRSSWPRAAGRAGRYCAATPR
jgi:hypothetical protein